MDKKVEDSEKRMKRVYDELRDAEHQYEQAKVNMKAAAERLRRCQEQCKGYSERAHRELGSMDKKLDVIAAKLALDSAREHPSSCSLLHWC